MITKGDIVKHKTKDLGVGSVKVHDHPEADVFVEFDKNGKIVRDYFKEGELSKFLYYNQESQSPVFEEEER